MTSSGQRRKKRGEVHAVKSSSAKTGQQQSLSETEKSGKNHMCIFLRNMELNTRKLEGIWKGLKVIAFKEQE